MSITYELRSGILRGARGVASLFFPATLPFRILALRPGMEIPPSAGIQKICFQRPRQILLKKTRTRHRFLPLVQKNDQRLRARPVWMARIREARVYGPDIAVCTRDGRLLREVSLTWEKTPRYHPIFRSPRFRPTRRVPGPAALLAVTGGNTYYHWMLECLPRLRLLSRIRRTQPGLRFVVNGFSRPFQKQTLELLGVPIDRCISLEEHPSLEFAQLWVPSPPCDPGISDPETIRFLRSMAPTPSGIGKKRKLFLTRKTGGRRIVHQEPIRQALVRRGFTCVDPGEWSLTEQIRLFQGAELVVAPHGAALANIIFCRPGATIVELFSGTYVNVCYQHLAGVCGLRHHSVHPWRFHDRLLHLDSRDSRQNPSDIPVRVADVLAALAEIGKSP